MPTGQNKSIPGENYKFWMKIGCRSTTRPDFCYEDTYHMAYKSKLLQLKFTGFLKDLYILELNWQIFGRNYENMENSTYSFDICQVKNL